MSHRERPLLEDLTVVTVETVMFPVTTLTIILNLVTKLSKLSRLWRFHASSASRQAIIITDCLKPEFRFKQWAAMLNCLKWGNYVKLITKKTLKIYTFMYIGFMRSLTKQLTEDVGLHLQRKQHFIDTRKQHFKVVVFKIAENSFSGGGLCWFRERLGSPK